MKAIYKGGQFQTGDFAQILTGVYILSIPTIPNHVLRQAHRKGTQGTEGKEGIQGIGESSISNL